MSAFKLSNKSESKAKAQTPKQSLSDLLDQAAAGQFYWDVKNDEKILHNKLVITGAEKRWKTQPDFVYVPEYRVCGTTADIEWFMGELEVDEYTTYTADDAENPDFVAEVEAYEQRREEAKEADTIDDETYQSILDNLHSLHFYTEKKEASATSYKNPRGRYDTLDSEHVLDVSKRENEGEKAGKGSVVVKKDDLPNNHVQGPTTIRIVSNNAKSYEAELYAIGKWTTAEIKDAVAKWQKNFDGVATRKKTAIVLTGGVRPPVRRVEKKK